MKSIIHHIYACENLTSTAQQSLALTDLQGIVEGIVHHPELTHSAKSYPRFAALGSPGSGEEPQSAAGADQEVASFS